MENNISFSAKKNLKILLYFIYWSIHCFLSLLGYKFYRTQPGFMLRKPCQLSSKSSKIVIRHLWFQDLWTLLPPSDIFRIQFRSDYFSLFYSSSLSALSVSAVTSSWFLDSMIVKWSEYLNHLRWKPGENLLCNIIHGIIRRNFCW